MGSSDAPGSFSVSHTAILIYRTGGLGTARQLTLFDRRGKVLGTVGEPSDYVSEMLFSGTVMSVDVSGNRRFNRAHPRHCSGRKVGFRIGTTRPTGTSAPMARSSCLLSSPRRVRLPRP
jgi:hypothetical protein